MSDNISTNDSVRKKKSKKYIYILLSVIVILAALLCVFRFTYVEKANKMKNANFGSEVTFYNDDRVRVRYDQKGNQYTFEEYQNNEFLFYDKDGNTYIMKYDEDNNRIFNCYETGKKYTEYSKERNKNITPYKAFIDENGNIALIAESDIKYIKTNDNYFVAFDSSKNVYYYLEECYWTPDGEFKATKTMQDNYEIAKTKINQ